ncbi:MAG: winged helix DNA-binding domain-containing protein [Cellulomonadaceae bacterium]|nr:winged helix DNA-binding domain-containing protein [Cellulomonadaceae bacterium]
MVLVPETITLAQARRIAIAAQRLAKPPRSEVTPGIRQATAMVQHLGVVQIDSVNVLARAHLMPLYSRLGPYDVGLLDRLASQTPRRITEAWAHEASFVPVDTWPLLNYRRRASRDHWLLRHDGTDASTCEAVQALLAEHGPLTGGQMHRILDTEHPGGPYWGTRWTAAKAALEVLFAQGSVCVAGRSAQFERIYDVTERVIPPSILSAPIPDDAECVRRLMAIAARAHGVATARDLRDYFRLSRGAGSALAREALPALVESGEILPVTVRGLPADAKPEQWFLHRDAVVPRTATHRTLLSPFDPLIFERTRLLQLFDMHYRIGIYTPADQRTHGYYVLPFLDGDQLTARVDLKAHRKAGVLSVEEAHVERCVPPGEAPAAAERLARELRRLQTWLGLETLRVEPRGDLAEPLQQAVRKAARR